MDTSLTIQVEGQRFPMGEVMIDISLVDMAMPYLLAHACAEWDATTPEAQRKMNDEYLSKNLETTFHFEAGGRQYAVSSGDHAPMFGTETGRIQSYWKLSGDSYLGIMTVSVHIEPVVSPFNLDYLDAPVTFVEIASEDEYRREVNWLVEVFDEVAATVTTASEKIP